MTTINYRLIDSRRSVKKIILIKQCPVCGREGHLQKNNKKFAIAHENRNDDKCTFGYCDSYNVYDDLKEIYYKVRRNE